jgi:ABC-type sugar transport system ATPase subunit
MVVVMVTIIIVTKEHGYELIMISSDTVSFITTMDEITIMADIRYSQSPVEG